MPSMTPNLQIYLNAVMSFLMLGELIYLHFSRIGTSSSKSNFLTGAPSGSISDSPTSSLLASMTMAELGEKLVRERGAGISSFNFLKF
jgi:hypothetical protein